VAVQADELERFLEEVSRRPGGVCYPQNLKIYAPTAYGRKTDAVRRLYREVAKLFRGATVYVEETGLWLDERGEVEEEPIFVIEAAHNCLTREQAERLSEAILEYAREAEQATIAVRQGNFYVFPTEELARALRGR
jgi:hypothetical protein